jgi:hypothetical protein
MMQTGAGTGRIAGVLAGGKNLAGGLYQFAKNNPLLAGGALAGVAGTGYLAYNRLINPTFSGPSQAEMVAQTQVPFQEAKGQGQIPTQSISKYNYAPNPQSVEANFSNLPQSIPNGYLDPVVVGKERLRLQKENETLTNDYKLNSIYQQSLGYRN